MTRLPVPGQDDDVWGVILNDFLEVSHNPNGTLQTGSIIQAGAVTSVNGLTPSNGAITLTGLPVSGTAGGDLAGSYPDPTVVKVNGIGVSGTPGIGQSLVASSSSAAGWTNPFGTNYLYVDAYGADPTGATDSTAAFVAAQNAGGSNPYILILGVGTYVLGTTNDIHTFGPNQGMVGQGSAHTFITYMGNGTCVNIYNATFNSSANGGKFDGFSINGSSAGSSAVGMAWGNMQGARCHDISIGSFNGASAVGLQFKNGAGAWSEQAEWTAIRLILNTVNVLYDTDSFDYSLYQFLIVAYPGQDGVRLQNNAVLEGVRFEVRGNFYAGVSNTAAVIAIDRGNSAGQSRLDWAQLFINVECDGSSGQGHYTILMNGGNQSQFTGTGILRFVPGSSPTWQGYVNTNGSQFEFSGQFSDPILGESVDSLVVQGGTQWAIHGSFTFSITATIYTQYGDIQAFLLASGNTSITFSGTPNVRGKRMELFLVQPSSGSPGTITWPGNVYWPAGVTPTLSTTNGQVDQVRLTYLGNEGNWYGELVGTAAKLNQVPLSLSAAAAAGEVLTIANTTSAPTNPNLQIVSESAGDNSFGVRAYGDLDNRFKMDSNGKMQWGPGNVTQDTDLYRSSSDTLTTDGAFTAGSYLSAPMTVATGLSGATAASRYVGATTGGAPASGTFDTGDYVIDQTGKVWICTSGGSPGTWAQAPGAPLSLSAASASGEILTVTNTTSSSGNANLQLISAASGDNTFAIEVAGDTNNRLKVDSSGKLQWGSGSAVQDTDLYRSAVATLTTDGSLSAGASLTAATFVYAPRFSASGLTGATATSRYVGATTSGAPTSGTFNVGDFIIDQTGRIWICTTAGTPGTWTSPAAPAPLVLSAAEAAGGILTVTNTTSAPSGANVQITTAAAGDNTLGIDATGDSNNRFKMDSNGKMQWGPGNATQDTDLYRSSSATLTTDEAFTAGTYLSAPRIAATGLTGATATSRYVGATTSGSPATGTFNTGDFAIDQTGRIWICTTGGSPGTWTAGNVTIDNTTTDIQPNGTQIAGSIGKAADSGHTHPASSWVLADNALLASAGDPAAFGGSGTMTAGKLYLVKIPIRTSITTSTIWWSVATAGSGASSGSYAGLYNSSGTLLATTTDIAGDLTTTGAHFWSISSQSLTAGTFVWVALLSNLATTQPALRAGFGGDPSIANINLTAATYQAAANGTGLSSLPSTITPSSNTSGIPVWAGLS